MRATAQRATPLRRAREGFASSPPRLGLKPGCSRGRTLSELDDPARRRCAAPQDECRGPSERALQRLLGRFILSLNDVCK